MSCIVNVCPFQSYNYSITDIISDDTMVALKFDLDTETDGNQYQIEPSPIPSRASMVIAKRMNIDYMDYRTWFESSIIN